MAAETEQTASLERVVTTLVHLAADECTEVATFASIQSYAFRIID